MKNRQLIYTLLILTIFMGQKLKAQDWPNLNRYRSENEKVAQAAPGENRIVFMGNSIPR